MKVAILGATRGVGSDFVHQALQLGHEITSIVRSPETYTVRHPELHVVKGNALDLPSFVDAFENQDVIVSGLGIRGTSGQPKSFYRDAAQNIVEAMKLTRVERLLCITSVGVHENRNAPLYYKLIVHPLLAGQYRDMGNMETVIRQTELDWTLIRPARLTNGKRTGKYKLT